MNSNLLNIVTWNVNGIRSRIFNNKTCSQLKKNKYFSPEINSSIYNLIDETNPDIICLQETRCSEYIGKLATIAGYNSYFNESKLDGARSCNRYSGTAIYSKLIPEKIEYQVPGYEDKEGRIIIAHYSDFIIINVYSPNSGTNYEKKSRFQDSILDYIKMISEKKIIYCGDFNLAIDTHFEKEKVKPCPGLYSFELDYYKKLIDYGFIDSISIDDNIVFTWWDQKSNKIKTPEGKETNVMRYMNKGWRIDYIFTFNISKCNSKVLKHIGEEYCPHASDHAPVFGKIFL